MDLRSLVAGGSRKLRTRARSTAARVPLTASTLALGVAGAVAWASPLHDSAQDDQSPLGPPALEVRIEEGERCWKVEIGGEPFTTVHLGDRIPYLFPVRAPGGAAVTRGFPMEPGPLDARDHPHHQSLWVAHGDVDGHDFWHDPEARIRLDGKPVVGGTRSEARLVLPLAWVAPGGKVVLREERTLAFAGTLRERWIDQTCRLLAPEEGFTLRDTKEGTFAVRLRPELRAEGEHAEGSLVNREGLSGKDTWGKASPWIACEGEVEGTTLGVTIFDHPDNPRFPTRWHARTYGLVAANPFGTKAFTGGKQDAGHMPIAGGSSITFRHRFLLTRGPRSSVEREAAARAFAPGGER